ncbi:MAG: hypothetical protein JST01_08000 [Cyanobacteria bacterium SZAS TMP-1]|nr:hypothetical protein [Cyanobacteria bacterium SZAS TMP-1]
MDLKAEVPKDSLDTPEIIRRGGDKLGGNEEYGLMKCPYCQFIYLYEYEADTIYLNPLDLEENDGASWGDPPDCIKCDKKFPQPWLDEEMKKRMTVSWEDLKNSEWRWVTQETRTD